MTRSQEHRAKHKEHFRKVGEALRDYYTGEDSQFHITVRALEDKSLSSRLGGPAMMTLQFERTTKQ